MVGEPRAAGTAGGSRAPTTGILPTGDIVGLARVVDGDTIVVGDTRIRLEGIDAPEADQSCGRAAQHGLMGVGLALLRGASGGSGAEATWSCGTAATAAMAHLVRGMTVACRPKGNDKYNRTLATCFANGRDINAEMVRTGMAWAYVRYSRAYVPQETEARAAHIGIWQGEAMPAWDWRHRTWTAVEAGAPSGCAIKGNVSRSGRIYHMPWSQWYGKISMDESKGTRWFCSETEAVAAGWRPAHAF